MSKTVSARISKTRHQELRDRCNLLGCSISEFVENSVLFGLDGHSNFGFEIDDEGDDFEPKSTEPKPIPEGRLVYPDKEDSITKKPYDVYNSTSGCYSRYRGNGELMFHFMPAEKINGIQYYRDTTGDNPNKKWYRSEQGDWIQRIQV